MPTPIPYQEAQLRQAEERLTAAERTCDSPALRDLLAPDFAGHNLSGRPTTRDSFIAAFSAPGLRFEQLEIDEVTYRIEGLTGIVCGRSQWRGRMGEREFTGNGRYLDVWCWRDNRWQLIAAAVTPQPAG
jgi:hypothetical protein